jgi:hypothetical protein
MGVCAGLPDGRKKTFFHILENGVVRGKNRGKNGRDDDPENHD